MTKTIITENMTSKEMAEATLNHVSKKWDRALHALAGEETDLTYTPGHFDNILNDTDNNSNS